MKTILAALVLAVACSAQAPACFIVSYPCDPPPDFLTYAVYDCAGVLVSLTRVAPTVPCRGWDECCIPFGATGRLELIAWRWDAAFGRYVITGSRFVKAGCP